MHRHLPKVSETLQKLYLLRFKAPTHYKYNLFFSFCIVLVLSVNFYFLCRKRGAEPHQLERQTHFQRKRCSHK